MTLPSKPLAPSTPRRQEPAHIRILPTRIGGAAGFTLLEVLLAVAILGISLSSMLASQVNSLQATRYARDISAAALLAEWKITELETQTRRDGWVNSDVEVDGDFSDQGWDQFNYLCTIHFIEMPEYNQLVEAKDETDEASGAKDDNMMSAGDQAFGAMGMVWPIVKAAIENSIRKVDCKVTWMDGEIEHEFAIQTFWTDPNALTNLPSAGGEFTESDDQSGSEGEGPTDSSSAGGKPGGGGTLPPSRGGGGQSGGMNMGGRP